MIYQIFSSGGVGDTLIVGLKINQFKRNLTSGDQIFWNHYERHECHTKPCLDIMKFFANKSEVFIDNQPEKLAKQECEKYNGKYLDTVAKRIINPYLNFQIPVESFLDHRLLGRTNYIVIQAQAGRMHDNTRREVGVGVIDMLLHMFPSKMLVILGPEEHLYETIDQRRIINLTGQTTSVNDALGIINDCSLFVGQDGIMAYYAMMQKKPSIVFFHLPNLVDHYFNTTWMNHSLAIYGAGNHVKEIPERLVENISRITK